MKILVGKFTLESNEHVPMMCDLEHVALSHGAESLAHMQLGDVFDRDDIEVIPTICADAACSGVMRRRAYEHIADTITNAIRASLGTLDGIYLCLHGASYVEKIGSGEHELLKRIRDIVGIIFPLLSAAIHMGTSPSVTWSTAPLFAVIAKAHTWTSLNRFNEPAAN